ncbi:hypothetical protein EJG51_010460 [Undibacterium piscinae]|uniref:Uncharacterized protein n=1 Tax=Undibacterium piscinae TaxID=2495591 RepID=A0A6M4A670_9BURK|nr:hypothetical protein EJG51_010460 [Undibacterium piscinae]
MSMSHVAKTDELWNQIDSFQVFQWKNYVRNRRMGSLLVVCGLLLSIGTTAAAYLEYTQYAVFLGLGTTMFIGFREAFNFSEKAEFFCEIHGQAKNLRDQVRFRVNSEADFNRQAKLPERGCALAGAMFYMEDEIWKTIFAATEPSGPLVLRRYMRVAKLALPAWGYCMRKKSA